MTTLIYELQTNPCGSDELDRAIASVFGLPWQGRPEDRYTTSVDCALQLIPPRYHYIIHEHGYHGGRYLGGPLVIIHSSLSSGGGPKWEGYAKTLPLALCLTCFRIDSNHSGFY